jgi:hypothetical protein
MRRSDSTCVVSAFPQRTDVVGGRAKSRKPTLRDKGGIRRLANRLISTESWLRGVRRGASKTSGWCLNQIDNPGSPSTTDVFSCGRSPLFHSAAVCKTRYRSGPPSGFSLRVMGRLRKVRRPNYELRSSRRRSPGTTARDRVQAHEAMAEVQNALGVVGEELTGNPGSSSARVS